MMSIIGISELEHIQVIILISKYQNLSKIRIGMATINFVLINVKLLANETRM